MESGYAPLICGYYKSEQKFFDCREWEKEVTKIPDFGGQFEIVKLVEVSIDVINEGSISNSSFSRFKGEYRKSEVGGLGE